QRDRAALARVVATAEYGVAMQRHGLDAELRADCRGECFRRVIQRQLDVGEAQHQEVGVVRRSEGADFRRYGARVWRGRERGGGCRQIGGEAVARARCPPSPRGGGGWGGGGGSRKRLSKTGL